MTDSSEDRWLADIPANGRAAWIRLYKELLKQPISDPERFWRALEVYGLRPMYEAIISTSIRHLDGDPLNYMLAVARTFWRKELEETVTVDKYDRDMKEQRRLTLEKSQQLADKMMRARERLLDE